MAEQAVSMRIGQRQRRGACDGCPGGADEAGVQHHVRGLPRRPLRAGRLLAAAVAAALIGTVRGGLEHLLTVMNKLQDVTSVIQDSGQATGIELPQIVVVGTQSSGKSSVLESIVGRDFLPRGSGIVTRAPLILQLQQGPASAKGECREYGEFLHCPQKKFEDFKQIREEIEAETQRIVGGNRKQAIAHKPIRLRITSPRVPNLTMVDLPGMTKVPVGDQPKDIEAQVRDLILKYIANPNSIILAVTPANSDIATSDAIQLAHAVDPKGDRTVGVLTKIDIMDKGTDAAEALAGRIVPLKLGFIGVINRSQKDIHDDKAMEDARADEIKFFRERPEYSALASAGRVGTAYLAKRLNSLLVMHIKTRLPALRNKLSSSLNSQRKELAALGDAPSGEADDLRKLLISLITQYVESFCTTIDGGRALTSFSELRGGARISQVFNELYPQRLSAIQATEALRPPDIHTTIRNTKGARTALYGSVPQDAFEMLVKKLIRHLREPAAWCVDTVFDELRVISEQCEPPELQRFESLRDKFREVVSELLGRCYKDAKKMMESLISFELAYINTNHPDFVDVGSVLSNAFKNPNGLRQAPPPRTRPASAAFPNAMGPAPPPAPPPGHKDPDVGIGAENILGVSNWFTKGVDNKGRQAPPPQQQAQTNKAQAELTEEVGETKQTVAEWLLQGLESTGMRLDPREQAEMELVVTLICSYFDIVRKNLRDAVPKATMHLMVNQAKDKVQVELLRSLYRDEFMENVFNEKPEVKVQRESCRKMIGVLSKAMSVLNEVHSLPQE